MKKITLGLLVFTFLFSRCASVITHTIDYPASDDLFVTTGDDPGTESVRPYIPKGQFIHVTQEAYVPIPILGIFIKTGEANPQIVFDTEVIPKIKSMGGDALTSANVSYTPASPWFYGLFGMRTGAITIVIGQVDKRPDRGFAQRNNEKDNIIQPVKTITDKAEVKQNNISDSDVQSIDDILNINTDENNTIEKSNAIMEKYYKIIEKKENYVLINTDNKSKIQKKNEIIVYRETNSTDFEKVGKIEIVAFKDHNPIGKILKEENGNIIQVGDLILKQ
jgi:hypothetical protein